MNSTVSNQTIKNDALQLLISAIARFCDIKTLRSLWGSNPHRFATCRGQPLNERGYLGEPSKRCGFCLLIQDSILISSYASSIADSGLHYDWKAAKMMVNLAYISLSNISDVMEKTFFDLMWHGQLCGEHGYLGWLSRRFDRVFFIQDWLSWSICCTDRWM